MKNVFQLCLLLSAATISASCGSGPPKGMPHWDGKFWAGDSKTESVVRTQDKASIKASDPQFDEGVWLTYKDLNCMYQQLILNCAGWKDQNLRCDGKAPPKRAIQSVLKANGY